MIKKGFQAIFILILWLFFLNSLAMAQEETTSSDDTQSTDDTEMMNDDMGMGDYDATEFQDIASDIKQETMEESGTTAITGEDGKSGVSLNYDLGGYIRNETYMFVSDDGEEEGEDALAWANFLEVRLKGEWNIASGLLAHVELLFQGNYGMFNQMAMADKWGTLDTPVFFGITQKDVVSLFSEVNYDFKHNLILDQAYMEFTVWNFTFQVGRMVLGWGMGYFINPTDRVNNPDIMNPTDQLPGTTAINMNLSLWQDTSIVAYATFEDRSHKNWVFAEDTKFSKVPFGVKFRTNIAGVYLGTGFIREVFYDSLSSEFLDRNYVFLEWFFDVWVFGFYGEGMFYVPQSNEDTDNIGFDYIFNGMAGLSYTFSEGPEIRLEYYRQGWGQDNPEEYEVNRIMSGDLILAAKDYLLLYIEKGWWGKFFISLIVVMNMHDYNLGLFPRITYNVYEDCEISLGGFNFIFYNEGEEFSGEYTGTDFDMIEQMIYVRMKVSF